MIIGCGRDTSEGGGQLALECASIDDVRYLGGGVYCLIRGGKRGFIFETGAGFHGIVSKDRCSQRVRWKTKGSPT